MTRQDPKPTCYELSFQGAYPIGESAEVALEDYARVLVRAQAAETVRASDDPVMVRGVHVCGLDAPVTRALLTDLEEFARTLLAGPGGTLGWS